MSWYDKYFDETKYISSLTEDEQLLRSNNKVWNEIIELVN